MPEAVVGWCARCWARWGGIGSGKFYIWEGMIYCTPIWDVLAPGGEQEGALNRLRMRSRSPAFLIRKAVSVGLPQAHFCCWARWAQFFMVKFCIMVDTVYLHTSHLFLWLKGGGNRWMGVDELRCHCYLILDKVT
jgi:hypothetical protein